MTTSTLPLPFDNPVNNQQWAKDLLTALQDPLTTTNVNFISAWEQTEGGAGSVNFSVEHNPISSSYPVDGSNAFNSNGIQSYGTFDAGIQGAVADIEGTSTQTALEPKLQTELSSGNATYDQLAAALTYGNGESSYAGAGPGRLGASDSPKILSILTGSSGGLSTVSVNPLTGTPGTIGTTSNTVQSATSSVLSRIVIGLIAIMLLGIGVDQLFKGGNSPVQVIAQGTRNNARRVKKSAETGAMAVSE